MEDLVERMDRAAARRRRRQAGPAGIIGVPGGRCGRHHRAAVAIRNVHKTLPDLLRPGSTPPGTPPPRLAAETERSDGYGQVHGHRGLYVVDGAAVPSATGNGVALILTGTIH